MSDQAVDIVRVGYGKKAWEADLCEDCYGEFFNELEGYSRKLTKTQIGKSHRLKKTTIAATNL